MLLPVRNARVGRVLRSAVVRGTVVSSLQYSMNHWLRDHPSVAIASVIPMSARTGPGPEYDVVLILYYEPEGVEQ